ncbi:MAG: FliH/SctL family protein [Steroidobacter sp.]
MLKQTVLVAVAEKNGTTTPAADVWSHEASSSVPVSEMLSIEQVLEWLSRQEKVVRMQLAHSLNDEMEQLRSEAIIEGRIAGTKAAKSEFDAQHASALEVLRIVGRKYEELIAQEREMFTSACADVVGTALMRLAGEVLVKREATVAAVKQAIQQVCGAREVVIRVNGKDLEAILACKSEIAEILGDDGLTIVADQRVSTGGCLLESSFGGVDARWETQLKALLDVLRDNSNSGMQP